MRTHSDFTTIIKLACFPNPMNSEFFGLSERRFEMFPKYSSSGIIIANMDDVIHNFNSLVVDQGHKEKPITEDLPQGEDPVEKTLNQLSSH